MQKLGSLINNNSINSNQLNFITIWKDIIPEEAVNKTTPCYYNEQTKEIKILVHDNIWNTELKLLKDAYIEEFNNRGLKVENIEFKYSLKHDKYDIKPVRREYPITEQAESYIKSAVNKIENKKIAENIESFLRKFFKYNEFKKWIVK